ncbi:MAG: hypothetical protein ACE5FG_00050 [Myxococcota bacterium]
MRALRKGLKRRLRDARLARNLRRLGVRELPIELFVEKLRTGEPFAASRFGDGEWNCILGVEGRNCDDHEYFPELRTELSQVLEGRPPYLLGLQPGALREPGARAIQRFLSSRSLDLEWFDSDVFQRAHWEGRFNPFVNALRERRPLFVGPRHIRAPLSEIFPRGGFVEIPALNCFLARGRIETEIQEELHRAGYDVILFSAGMTTNLLIDRLHVEVGERVTLIDLGSIWDVYAGRISRRHFHDDWCDWKEVMRINTAPAEPQDDGPRTSAP